MHGSNPDCRACHMKLDPLGATFASSAMTLSSRPSPGALAYRSFNGTFINKPVRGIGELAQQIVKTPEYRSCQINHFWKWYIGQDVEMTEERRKDLEKVFDQVGRRTNDFIQYLVQLPEFNRNYPPPSEQSKFVRQVRSILSKCNSCHKEGAHSYFPLSHTVDKTFPDFNRWPIGGTAAFAADWLVTIKKTLTPGAYWTQMPPENSPFKIKPSEIELLKKWVDLGGPDENGKRQIDP